MLHFLHNRSFLLARLTFGHQKELGFSIRWAREIKRRDHAAMGGGNAQKSKMVREKKLEKPKAAGKDTYLRVPFLLTCSSNLCKWKPF
ncbi:hypothetical protein L1887_14747 [Cichorium endivia]|nr:hypothetical protein L1887_14747 [Cichorium endivia]